MKTIVTFVVLVCAGVASRLVPHPPNVTAVAALALVGGLYLGKRTALLVPLAAMVVSDAVLGFHGLMAYVYVGFVFTGVVGMLLRSAPRIPALIGGSLTASIVFFLLTNAGVWITGDGLTYPRTAEGLLECYTAALPFFGNSLAGDLLYSGLLAGVFEGARRWVVHPEPVEER